MLTKPLPESARASMELWTGCIAGALLDREYEAKLRAAGFTDVGVEPTRVYGPELNDPLDGAVMSAFVRARKPA